MMFKASFNLGNISRPTLFGFLPSPLTIGVITMACCPIMFLYISFRP